MKFIKTTIAILSVTAFLFIGSIGMLSMTDHHHEPGCPFMPGEQVICQMDVFDHIGAWQSTFTTILPTLVLYLFLAAVVFVAWQYYSPPDLFVRVPINRRRLQPARVSVVQELFSSGILNPRAP